MADTIDLRGFAVAPAEKGAEKAVQSALRAGFASGWTAAMQTVAGQVERFMERWKASGRPTEALIDAAKLLANLRAMAARPPVPEIVAMKAGETPEQAVARTSKKENLDA